LPFYFNLGNIFVQWTKQYSVTVWRGSLSAVCNEVRVIMQNNDCETFTWFSFISVDHCKLNCIESRQRCTWCREQITPPPPQPFYGPFKGTLRHRLSHGYFSFIAKYISSWFMSHRLHPQIITFKGAHLVCEFRMHVWNVLHAARWQYRMQKVDISAPSHNICRAISSQLRRVSTIGKKLVKHQYLLHLSS